jgi:mRNA cleavage and polyadenylation factor CLP1 P-loop
LSHASFNRDSEGEDEDGDDSMHDDDPDRAKASTKSRSKKKSKNVPLFVNTMGWTSGLGADLSARIEEVVRCGLEVVVTFTMGGEGADVGSHDLNSRQVVGEGKGAYTMFGDSAPPSSLAGMDVGMMASLCIPISVTQFSSALSSPWSTALHPNFSTASSIHSSPYPEPLFSGFVH